ncbi:MAG: PEGA domain-containing protein [Vicinamibacteria bacterium]
MKTFKIAQMVPLVLIAASSFAQGDNHAVPRSGGSGSSSSAGSSHTSSSGGGSSSSSSSGGGSSSASSGGSGQQSGGRYDSGVPDAARRRPRPGTGTGDRGRYGNSYRSSPYSSYYYDPYSYGWGYSRPYGSYGYGYGLGLGYGYNDYGYSYGDYSGYYPSSSYRSYRYRSGNVAQVRTLVEPSKARVYVDGYYAGTVDDFDGLLQRLNVSPGRHEISFRLEGYKSHTFSIYANRDQTLKIRWDMAKGEGETRDSMGEENERESDRDRERMMDRDDRDRSRDDRDRNDRDRNDRDDRAVDSDRDRHDSSGEVDAQPRLGAPSRMDGERGELLLDVQPSDASVYVDGEFYGKAGQVSRLDLPAGRHRVEVVRPGYKTEEAEVTVDRETKKVVVKLERR